MEPHPAAPPLPWPRLHLGHVGMAIIDSLMELRPAFNQCIWYGSFNQMMDVQHDQCMYGNAYVSALMRKHQMKKV